MEEARSKKNNIIWLYNHFRKMSKTIFNSFLLKILEEFDCFHSSEFYSDYN
jgi:hypothetical protein